MGSRLLFQQRIPQRNRCNGTLRHIFSAIFLTSATQWVGGQVEGTYAGSNWFPQR